jgi:hypothetical protein
MLKSEIADSELISKSIAQFRPAIDALLKYIRARFPNVDIKALSEAARNRNVKTATRGLKNFESQNIRHLKVIILGRCGSAF